MSKNYQREPDGMRLKFRGMNTMQPPDRMPQFKYPYAQNVRAYLGDRVSGRATQDSSVQPVLAFPIHTIRRLNDLTPAGPINGFVLITGAGTNLYANAAPENPVPLSGNPLSLVPFRPNASVQPWMYVGDSAAMLKVRSDGTCYKMGIKEPQLAPAVTIVPASDKVSLVGAVTVTYWGDSPHSGPTGNYIWKNASDLGGSGPVRNGTPPTGVTTGNSLLFDVIPGNNTVPMAWTVFTEYQGTVSTVGTVVSWQSGSQFNGLVAGNQIVITGVTYAVAAFPAPTNTTISVTVSAGNQSGVTYQAAAISGTNPLFQPALESEGYSDFNFALEATLYIPVAGTYTLSFNSKDEVLWGIGNNGNGNVSWPAPSGGTQLASSGQTITALNGYPLIPKLITPDGAGQLNSATVGITFTAAGNYPIEIDFDYWFHSGRTLTVKCNGVDIPPIPQSVITEAQYRYVYRSSATGALSNPSPESTQVPLSVIANNVTATPSTDPQVDKIDFYRLDQGLTDFTYVGTVQNIITLTQSRAPVTVTGSAFTIPVGSVVGAVIGGLATIDTGPSQETVTIIGIFPGGGSGIHIRAPQITAVFTLTHAVLAPITYSAPALNDTLLDTDIANNPILEFDNFEPFPSIDLPRKGTVNVDSGVVMWNTGDQFNTRWLPGTIIVIGTTAFTLNTRPTSATNLTATNVQNVAGIQEVITPAAGQNLVYEIAEPILAAQPMPYLWGPTDNISFFFGVGDPLRPGTLYWSKGNNPDSAPDTNQQDVTSPSEPLINGCLVNGYGWVASSERGWLIIPNFFNALATATGTQGATWTLQESSLKRGLFIPRCIAVDGGANVFFRAKDGIYISPGGQGGRSITDEDLYNLFPHEGFAPAPVTIGGFTVFPPDDTQPQLQKFAVATGYLYYDYVDVNGNPRILVYDITNGGWCVDVYQHTVTVHALEEGPSVNGTLTGCLDGSVRALDSTGAEAATSVILMPSSNAGDTRASKHFVDIYIEAE